MNIQHLRGQIQKKSIIIIFLLFVLLVGLTGALYLYWRTTVAVVTMPQQALVSIISGTPEVSTDDITFRAITDGEQISAGTTIRTDSQTRALIVFSDNSVVTLDVNTQIKLAELSQNREENNITILQQLGKIFSQVEKIFGIRENFQVNANGLIAAVRGTKFGSGILPDGQVRVYVKESKVAVMLADQSQPQSQEELLLETGKELVMPTDQGLSKDQFEQNSKDYQSDQSEWDKLNECLAQTLDSIQQPQQANYNYIISRYQELINACVETTPTEVTESPIPQPSAPAAALPAKILSLTDNGSYTETSSISCSWASENADSYSFAIGSYPGYTDVVNWIVQTSTNYSNSGLALNYGAQYFCTVLPTGPGGTEGWKTSDGIWYDNSSGSLLITGPSIGKSGTVTAKATLNIPAATADVNAYFYAKCNAGACAGQYFNGNGWTSSPTWFKFNKSISGNDLILNPAITLPSSGTYDLYGKLINDKTGKPLQNDTPIAVFGARGVRMQ